MVFRGCCINILVHFASFKSTVIDLEICKDIVALFEDFQFYGQAINSVHQLRRFSLKAVPEEGASARRILYRGNLAGFSVFTFHYHVTLT